MIVAAALAVLVVGGLAAFFGLGLRFAPSAADQARARELFAQSQTQLENGNKDAAFRMLDDSIRLAPQNDALRSRASIFIARGDFENATQDMSRIANRGNALATDYSLRCWLRARNDRTLRGARSDCDRAIKMNPGLAAAFGNRGLVGLRQGRNIEAWNDFNIALRVGGSDEWVAWRVFGRGVAAWGQGRGVEGRQDIETALHSKPAVAGEFAQFGIGGEIVREFDDATFARAMDPPSYLDLQNYLIVYPNGAHAAEARAEIQNITDWVEGEIAAGRQAIPGFALAQVHGPGSPDSFGAIALSRSSRRVAFSTDYASPLEAQRAAATACDRASQGDCEAFAFRNVCAALALSPSNRSARGMAWSYSTDDAVRGSIQQCNARGGRNCVAVHAQCTPTPEAATPAPSP